MRAFRSWPPVRHEPVGLDILRIPGADAVHDLASTPQQSRVEPGRLAAFDAPARDPAIMGKADSEYPSSESGNRRSKEDVFARSLFSRGATITDRRLVIAQRVISMKKFAYCFIIFAITVHIRYFHREVSTVFPPSRILRLLILLSAGMCASLNAQNVV